MKIINAYRALDARLGQLLLAAVPAIRTWLGPGTVGRHERGGRARGRRWHAARHRTDQALTVGQVLRRLQMARLAEGLLAA